MASKAERRRKKQLSRWRRRYRRLAKRYLKRRPNSILAMCSTPLGRDWISDYITELLQYRGE